MKKIKFFISIFLIVFGFSSCILFQQMAIKTIEKRELIPKEFGKDSTVLLIMLTDSKIYNFHVKNMVKRYYHGEIEFCPEFDFVSHKYSKSKYRYQLKTINGTAMAGTTPTRIYYVSIKDRKTDIEYTYPSASSFYKSTYKAYLIQLDKQRIQNQ